MSAKTKKHYAASPTKELISVERLVAVSLLPGNHMVYEATLPGQAIYNGGSTQTLYVKIRAQRCRYVFFQFYADETSGSPGTVRIYEETIPGVSLILPFIYISPATTKNDYLHVHKVRRGISHPNPSFHFDPAIFKIQFVNGSGPSMNSKNLVVGGCNDPTGPFLVTQAGLPAVNYSYSE